MNEPKIFWTKNKVIIVVLLALFIVLAVFGGNSYIGLRKDKKALKSEILDLAKEKEVLKDSVIYFKDELLFAEDVKEENFYDKYVREYNLRIKAEKYAEDIKNLLFTYPYLDSLAGAIEYR